MEKEAAAVVDMEVVAVDMAAVDIIKQIPYASNVQKFIEMPNLSSTVMLLMMITFNCDLSLGMRKCIVNKY